MFTVPSANFLKEFTLYADKVNDDQISLIVTRNNDKNVVVLSIEEYNAMKQQIFLKQK